jgi:Cu-Zn family superoxide dismutase
MQRLSLLLLLALGCATYSQPSGTYPAAGTSGGTADAGAKGTAAVATGPSATAAIEPRSDSTLTGTSQWTTVDGGLGAHVEVQGAAPGLHGVHVHEKGDCSDPKALSAGPHYNPNMGAHHGGPATPVRHGGDLGNIQVDSSGKGTLDVVVADVTVDDPANGIVGRAIVVHEKTDDLQTDPTGNSGARIGCGVIQRSTP